MTLFEFYRNVYYREMLNFRVRMDEVKNFLPTLCTASTPKQCVDTSRPVHRIGYTLIFCAYRSGVVEYFVQKALMECQEVKLALECLLRPSKNPKEKRGIRICSIGGGPGADAIGAMLGFTFHAHKNMLKSVIVIENSGHWRSTFDLVVRCVKFGCLRLLPKEIFDKRVLFLLKEANFLHSFSNSIKGMIKEANIILMVEFSSLHSEDSIQCAVKNIMETIENGSLIFFLDSSGKFTEMIITQWSNYGHIFYGPVWVKYGLPYVPEVFRELYGYNPQMSGTHFCMVLQKTHIPTDIREEE